jgi:hypothetical protein
LPIRAVNCRLTVSRADLGCVRIATVGKNWGALPDERWLSGSHKYITA